MDEFVDQLLHEERVCDIILPRIQKREVLEENGELGPRKSLLLDAMDGKSDRASDHSGSRGWSRSISVGRSDASDRYKSRSPSRSRSSNGSEDRRSRSRSRSGTVSNAGSRYVSRSPSRSRSASRSPNRSLSADGMDVEDS